MKPQKQLLPLTVLVLLVFGLVFFASLLAGCKKEKEGKPLEYPPPPPNVLLDSPGRPAQAAGAAIGKYVPAVMRQMPLRIVVVPPALLFQTRARDSHDPHPEGITGINGYCQMPDNRPEGNDGWTRIFLSDKLGEREAALVAGHEISHAAFWLVLTPEMREDWLPLWESMRKRKALPSDYAGTNSREGFAECALYWYQKKLKDEAARNYFDRLRADLEAAHPAA